ncbi:APC family permease [Actinotalea sp. M2MS4P-6]|uniref:APC family permease n=1 Tax=Actinotalea sp. M2MS4P-6 TaxID=2983762 RepID=UPI0021E4984C|nr:APC family permease [Actinotalea sp. M2MS4P-6]MCV2393824.1 APC family permease [Actinotalea sp. M2MS4P-6]
MTTTQGTATSGGVAPSSSSDDIGRTLSGNLGVGSIVFMVVAAAAPLTVIGGAAPLGIALGNGVGFPSLYAISGVVLLLFSVGLAAMARSVPRPGAFFTYVGYGMNRALGLGAAWLALLTYTAVQLAVYFYIGFSLNLYLTTLLGAPDIPWWAYSLATIALVGYLGYRNIELSSKVLGVLLVAEIGITLVLSFAVMLRGGAEGLSLEPFAVSNIVSGSPGVGLMLAFAGFIGFESTAIFRDEAKNPQKTIPRATYLAVIIIGVFYTFAGWALVMAWGPSQVQAYALDNAGSMIHDTAANYLGPVGGIAIETLLLTSLFACVLSFHNVLTRYQHVMGKVQVLPTPLSLVHTKHASPHVSSIAQTAVAALLIVTFAVIGLDPVMQGFTWASGLATIAIVVLMALTSVAVVMYFRRFPNEERNVWKSTIAPILATIGLIGVCATIVAYFPMLVGGDGWGLSIIILSLVPIALAIGVVQGLLLRQSRPSTYAGIIDAISV